MITYLASQTRRLARPNQALQVLQQSRSVRQARSFCALGQADRSSLIAEALTQNVDRKATYEAELSLEKDLPDVDLPHRVKLRARDSIPTRKWKMKQQFYYSNHQKFGYLDDMLVKKGWLSAELLATRRKFVEEQLAKPAAPTGPSEVTLGKLLEVQDKFETSEELKINEEDSLAVKKTKAMGQIQAYIEQTQTGLDQFPDANVTLKELRNTHRKLASCKEENIEEILLEYEKELEQETEYENVADFMKKNTHRMMDLFEQQANDPLNQKIKHKPLDTLGLIKQGSIDAIDDQLNLLYKVQKQRLEEFKTRYGQMPDDKEYDAQIEAEIKRQEDYDAKVTLELSNVEVEESKLDNDAVTEENKGETKEVEEEESEELKLQANTFFDEMDFSHQPEERTDIKEGDDSAFSAEQLAELAVLEKEYDEEPDPPTEIPQTQKYEEDPADTAVAASNVEDIIDELPEDVDAQAAAMMDAMSDPDESQEGDESFAVVTDSDDDGRLFETRSASGEGGERFMEPQFPKDSGPAPPKVDLSKYQHLKHLPYDEFIDPPTEFEAMIMDEFAREEQRDNAAQNGITLFPRIPVPAGPTDKSWIKKALLLYRIRAIRVHIENLKKQKKTRAAKNMERSRFTAS